MHELKRSYFGWGRTAAHSASPSRGLVIHYDGPGQNLTSKPHQDCISYWKSVRKYHMNSNGWLDIGYSFGVCPHSDSSGDGYVFEGRGLNREQAAQPGGNTTYYSVTLMLGDGEHPTDVQIQTVRELREWLHRKGNANTVKGHRDFISTSCPGSILYGMVKDGTFTKDSDDWQGRMMRKLPLVGKGDKGEFVQTVQGLLLARSHPEVKMTGTFDATTEKAVKAVQKWGKVDVDGIVGPQTWPVLLRVHD